MRAVIWGLAVTSLAAALFALAGKEGSVLQLRWMGVSGGAILAVTGVLFGVLQPTERSARAQRGALVPRFFRERRRSPRHGVDIPVRLSVNGHAYEAKLVSVSSSGALLRMRPRPGHPLTSCLGQRANIQDYPAGTVVRVGDEGMFVDFAVAFEASHNLPGLEAAR